MIDLHTHLLPDWDDGAEGWDEMLRMCDIACQDGIKKIVLTPHIFRLCKYSDDFELLEEKMTQFQKRMQKNSIEFYRGAEVFVHHEMIESVKRNNLAINGSNYVFVEFPAENVLPNVKDLFYKMMLAGFLPIISHPERNVVFGERPEILYELVEMGSLAQVTTKSLTGEFGRQTKRAAEFFMKNNLVHIIASDAHDAEKRPPVLSKGVRAAAKIVGEEKAMAMVTEIPQAILDNEYIPDWGEPIKPK